MTINKFLSERKIILASASPRRAELLKLLRLNFRISPTELSEEYPAEMPAAEVPLYLATLKAKTFVGKIAQPEIVIAADTVVVLQNKILGKPKDRAEALLMLQELSGRKHEVITGVCLLALNGHKSFSETTKVEFRVLSKEEIEFYVDNYAPYDKAGSYGCQEWIGAVAIKAIVGDYYNIMGLPLSKLYKELQQFD